jgi:hypothetical protein
MVSANDIGNIVLALASFITAYATYINDPKLAVLVIAAGVFVKAIGSYLSDKKLAKTGRK